MVKNTGSFGLAKLPRLGLVVVSAGLGHRPAVTHAATHGLIAAKVCGTSDGQSSERQRDALGHAHQPRPPRIVQATPNRCAPPGVQ
jgi:hypothetical protein